MNDRRFSISSWSLNGLITGGTALLDIPDQVAEHGIGALEVCHFHFPSTDQDYLSRFKAAVDAAKLEFFALLIDTGDIASPDEVSRAADINTISHWIDVASATGAKSVRICAGLQSPSPSVIERSAAALNLLKDYAAERGIKVFTENWQETSLQPVPLLEILAQTGSRVGLCADTGNAEGNDKYATLQKLLPKATSVHFKARYTTDGKVDLVDLDECIELMEVSQFNGPITLIYGDVVDEWQGVDELKRLIATRMTVA